MKKLLLTLLFLAGTLTGLYAQKKERIVYAVKNKDILWFDRYMPEKDYNNITLVFVHGGAFTGGHPDNQKPLAEGMTKLGYQVIVLKYRLYLQGRSFGCETATSEKTKAIYTAMEDVRTATEHFLRNASRYRIDTGKMFIAGSSAGAEAVLNLVYDPYSGRKESAPAHPYKGILSFAGALLDITPLERNKKIPLLLMHGTNDQLVPFATAPHRFCNASDAGWMMMFGSETIFNLYQQAGAPAVLYAYNGKGHEVSNFMFREFEMMDAFMKAVLNNQLNSARYNL